MATDLPHDYSVASGSWDTDIEYLTGAPFLTGDGSLHFINTTPADDPIMASAWHDWEPGQPVIVESWMRASSNSAANHVGLFVQWYTSAPAYISTSTIFDAAVTTADTWELKSGIATAPATTAIMRVLMSKTKTAFHSYVDSMWFRRFPKCFRAHRASGQSASAGDYLSLTTGEEYDHGMWFDGTDTATIPATGIYSFCSSAIGDELDADEYFILILRKASGGAYSDVIAGSLATSRTADLNDSASSIVTYTGLFSAGETVKVQIQHSHSGTLPIIGSSFSGTQIM